MFSRYGLSATKNHAIIFLALLSSGGFNLAHAADYSSLFTAQEAKIDKFRDAEIKQIQLVITRSSSREQKPDLLLRLAELYTEKYRLFFLKENEQWTKASEAFLAMPLERQKYSKKPTLDNSTSKQWLNKAVAVLERIPDQKEKYNRLDEVYYFLGFNQWELGRKREGVANFESIIRSFPQSRFAPEAFRYVADFSFADRNFARAKSLYQKAAQFTESPARAKVLYGLAWSQFKLKEYKSAVATMHEAIVLGKGGGNERSGLALQRDAAESLAMFYSEGGKVDEAVGFFTDLFGEQEGAQILRKLAEAYQSQGKYSQALSINKQVIALGGAAAKEGDQQRFEIMVDSLKIATTKGDRGREAAVLKSLTTEYVTNAKEPQEEKVAALQAQVRKSATLAHKEGNKSKNSKEAFARAEDMYRLYLSAYASRIKPDDAAEIHFYLADVMAQMGRHKEAAAEYGAMVDQAQTDIAYKKYQKDAASGMVYALDNYFKGKSSGKAMSKADGDQVITSIDAYVRLYPRDKDSTKYLARAAGILVTSGRMNEAKPRLMDIIERYSNNQEAWDAAATLLKDAEDKKDYEEASRLAKLFLENRGLLAQDKKGEFKKRLESIASRAEFQQVRKVEENKDYGEAAIGYEKLASNSKDSEVRIKALNNAAVSYQKAKDRANEMRVYKKTLELYPGNEGAEKSILGIGNEHFLNGQFEEAAEVYEFFYGIYEGKLGSLKGNSQKAALESIRSAALLRTALKQTDKSADNFRKIVEAANKGIGSARDSAGEFLFDTAKRYRDEGNTTEAVRSFQKYISSFGDGPHVVGANLEVALLYTKLREEEKALTYFKNTAAKAKAKGSKASNEDLSYGARARLELLAPAEEAFEKAQLRLPEAQLKADINAKLAALDKLNKGYIEVMDFGDGTWGVEAYRRMAMAYRNFGQKLEGAPIPAEYSAEDKAKFKAQLKNVAAPVYLKVGETLDTALQKGENLGVVGPVMARVYLMSVLTSARPDRLPLVQSINWDKPAEWIMGDQSLSDSELEAKRKSLRTKSDDVSAWVAIGNRHMLRGEDKLAEIFYLHALDINSKYGPAINNLAYLKGRDGDLAKAMSGFKSALAQDEFAVVPKKNVARVHMASGLWRHTSLAYRQLEVRAPNDKEVKRGLSLANLATGKLSQVDSGLISQGSGDNGKFAEAILALAKGERNKAANAIESLASENEFAQLILTFWNTKETK